MVAIGIHAEGVSRQVGGDEENHGVHDRGDGEGSGAGAEGSEDSDGSRSGQDNRERLLEDEVGELRKEVEHLRSQSHLLFLMVLFVLVAVLVEFLRLVVLNG